MSFEKRYEFCMPLLPDDNDQLRLIVKEAWEDGFLEGQKKLANPPKPKQILVKRK